MTKMSEDTRSLIEDLRKIATEKATETEELRTAYRALEKERDLLARAVEDLTVERDRERARADEAEAEMVDYRRWAQPKLLDKDG